jgi:hypothetical protein
LDKTEDFTHSVALLLAWSCLAEVRGLLADGYSDALESTINVLAAGAAFFAIGVSAPQRAAHSSSMR